MIPYQSKYDSQKLSADRHQSLGFLHPSAQGTLVPGMHRSALPDSAQGRKVQELAYKRPAAFGDAEFSFMLPRTDLVQIKPRELHDLGDRAKLGEVAYFADQARRSDRPDPLERKNDPAVWNLFQMPVHLSLQPVNKAIIGDYRIKHQPDLQKHAAAAV